MALEAVDGAAEPALAKDGIAAVEPYDEEGLKAVSMDYRPTTATAR